MNFRSPGCFKGFGAFIEGGPGGIDIINDEDTPFPHFALVDHMEGVFNIVQALFAVQARLRLRPACSEKTVERYRQPQPAPESPGKQTRLVEAALSQALDMKGDGKNHVYRQS